MTQSRDAPRFRWLMAVSLASGPSFKSLPERMGPKLKNKNTTLSGGSLGTCVDEERSQLRELM